MTFENLYLWLRPPKGRNSAPQPFLEVKWECLWLLRICTCEGSGNMAASSSVNSPRAACNFWFILETYVNICTHINAFIHIYAYKYILMYVHMHACISGSNTTASSSVNTPRAACNLRFILELPKYIQKYTQIDIFIQLYNYKYVFTYV